MNDVHIVTVNYKMKSFIVDLLKSLYKDIQGEDIAAHITVVDNSQNSDQIKESLETLYPEVQYIDAGGNIGFGRASNLGFQSKKARYYFAINPDTVIPSGQEFIKKIIAFMDKNPKIGAVGPKVVHFDDTLQYTAFRFDLSSILVKPFRQLQFDKKFPKVKQLVERLEMRDMDHNATRAVDWVLGAAIMVRHEVISDIGWFDERFFMYLEDCDWCRRMWEAGWPVYYLHDIVLKHNYTRGSSKIKGMVAPLIKNKLARIHLMSWVKYLWKWRGNNKYYEYVS